MEAPRIDSSPNLNLEPTHARERPRPTQPFSVALDVGAAALVAGSAVASRVVGAPVLSAAVRVPVASVSSYAPAGSLGLSAAAPSGVLGVSGGAGATASVGGVSVGVGAAGGTTPGLAGGGSEIDQWRRLQQESQASNMQMLELQEQVQQENRHFTTVSNLLRARHETIKNAIGNIRS